MDISEALGFAAGIMSRNEARVLLAALLDCSKETLITHPSRELSAYDEACWIDRVARAAAGEPIPYITGTQEFWSRPFAVTPDTLIPRPDTETLVEAALAVLERKENPEVLDLGTGSGCIAVTLALENKAARVYAAEVCRSALKVAKTNAATLGASVDFRLSDWFSEFEGMQFDLIVSNPPYIEPDDEHLTALTYEPENALTDGIDGLTCISAIAAQAPLHLKAGGIVIVEHGYNQGEAVRKIFCRNGFGQVETFKDLGENDRICVARLTAQKSPPHD